MHGLLFPSRTINVGSLQAKQVHLHQDFIGVSYAFTTIKESIRCTVANSLHFSKTVMKIFLSLVCLAIGGIVVEIIGARLERASGGTPVSIEDAPYFVSLRRDALHVCSGASISTHHVLTAAHCVLDKSFKRLYTTRVVSGTDKFDPTDVGHGIGEIIPHKDFLRGKSSCDIAVVKVLTHFEWNGNQMELPNAGPRGSMVATLTGYKLRGIERSDVGLQELRVKTRPIIPTDNNSDNSDQVFYGTVKRCQSVSNVDIGGALVYERKIIGIVFKIPDTNKRSCYFINVASFKTFIEKSMERSANLERQSVISWAPKRSRF